MNTTTYPQRPPHFAIKYIKWLRDSGVINELGPDSFALLVAVVMREDDVWYKYAPNFYNSQLMQNCGIASEPALIRSRKRAIELELLVYVPSVKRRPGVYFVTGFTNDSIDNNTTHVIFTNDSLGKAKGTVRENEMNCVPSYPIPIPNPNFSMSGFVPPSLEEVKAYCSEDGLHSVNCQMFLDRYTSQGWRRSSGSPVTDWKLVCREWNERNVGQPKPQSTYKKRKTPGEELAEALDKAFGPDKPQRTHQHTKRKTAGEMARESIESFGKDTND